MKTLHIVKIGGRVVSDEKKIASLLDDFSKLNGSKILVHGGGNVITDIAVRLGYPTTMKAGRRITDKKTMNVVTMVSAGLLNKTLVGKLQKRSCNAIGICGADGKSILSKRRSVKPINYGCVGDIISVREQFISALLQAEMTPVFSSITMNIKGGLLNTNADAVAAHLAIALGKQYATQLYFCIDKPGVLKNKTDETSLISDFSFSNYTNMLATKELSEGMIPKLQYSFEALNGGVKNVSIGDFNVLKSKKEHTTIIL